MFVRTMAVVAVSVAMASCGGAVDVDPKTALPGSWLCDDEILLKLQTGGRYEWRVPPGGPVHFAPGSPSNEHVRMETDGGYSLLGAWRQSGTSLEIDMFGETDKYGVAFATADSLSLSGPESYSCKRQ